jgi:hypothetical protein
MSKALAERIWSSFPVSQPAFTKLLGLLAIEADDDVPTACVTFGARSRLRISPGFVARACRNDAELVMLVLHELHHVVLGHTRLFRRTTSAGNFAFDAVINAHLSHLFEDWQGASLFRHTYRADVFPEALLRPPEDWRTGTPRWQMTGRALAVHKALYGTAQVSYTDVLALFPLVLVLGGGGDASDDERDESALEDVTLLGDHGDDRAMPTDLAASVRAVIARWPLVVRTSGRDQGGELARNDVTVERARREAVRCIRRAVLRVARRDAGTLAAAERRTHVESLHPLWSRSDRRGQARAVAGDEVLLWRNRVDDRSHDRVGRVHLYVDVSASMRGVLPLIYGAIAPLLAHLHPDVHLFSNAVADVGRDALRRGVATTTGGTDITAVTRHMLDHGVREAVIVTDGWVGDVPQEHARLLARRKPHVAAVVTKEGDGEFVRAMRGSVVRLPHPLSREAA